MAQVTNAQLKTAMETQATTINTNFRKIKTAFNNKVDKISGKGLSTNDFTNALKTKLDALPSNADLQTAIDAKTTMNAVEAKGYQTAAQVQSAISAANHLEKEIVQTLPSVSSAGANKIYLVVKSNGASGNVYDEFMVINGAFEKIGDTSIDLTGYALTSELPTKVSDLTNDTGFITGVSWTEVTNKPSTFDPTSHTHTKSEITDFPTAVSAFTNDAGYLTSHQDISAKVEAQDITDTINTIFGNLSVTAWDDITLS